MVARHEVWWISEGGTALAELCAAGRELGEKVTALVVGSPSEAGRAIRLGADAACWLGEAGQARLVEDYLETMAGLLERARPGLVLLRANKRGRLIAGRLGAWLGTAALADVKSFETRDGALLASHMLFGGGAVRVEKPCAATALALLPAGVYQAAPEDPARTGPVTEVPFAAPASGIRLLERHPRGGSKVDLAAARRVVGVGRGFAKQEDLAQAEELARALEAEVACSRPVAAGGNWMPRPRDLGVSGATIKPEVYLAMGISGQVQHMVGVLDSKIIVAVNKDKNAPIFQQADYGIVGDLYKVIPLLLAALK